MFTSKWLWKITSQFFPGHLNFFFSFYQVLFILNGIFFSCIDLVFQTWFQLVRSIFLMGVVSCANNNKKKIITFNGTNNKILQLLSTWTEHMERISEADSIQNEQSADEFFFLFSNHLVNRFFFSILICWHFNLTFAVEYQSSGVEKCAKTWEWKTSKPHHRRTKKKTPTTTENTNKIKRATRKRSGNDFGELNNKK